MLADRGQNAARTAPSRRSARNIPFIPRSPLPHPHTPVRLRALQRRVGCRTRSLALHSTQIFRALAGGRMYRFKLSAMMFLEFFIWGAWLPLIFDYLPSLEFTPFEIGCIL